MYIGGTKFTLLKFNLYIQYHHGHFLASILVFIYLGGGGQLRPFLQLGCFGIHITSFVFVYSKANLLALELLLLVFFLYCRILYCRKKEMKS